MALFEWGVKPEELFETWTEERLVVLFRARTRRIKRSNPKQDDDSGEKSEQEKAAVAKAFTPKKVKAKKAG